MKKLYLSITLFFMFILMFAVTMIPTKAYTFNNDLDPSNITLDTQINELNGYTLRDLFETSNLLANPYFHANLNGWLVAVGTATWDDGQALRFITNSSFAYLYQNNIHVIGDVYYSRVKLQSLLNEVSRFDFGLSDDNPLTNIPLDSSGVWYSHSSKYTADETLWLIRSLQGTATYEYYIDNALVVNLTYLQIDLSKEQLDYYYFIYETLKEGIDISLYYQLYYDDGYNEGFDEGYIGGYNYGFDEGYIGGYNYGIVQGYDDGYYEGQADYHYGDSYSIYDVLESEPYLFGSNVGYNEGIDYAVQENISILSIFELIFGVALNMLTFIITIDIFGISILSLISVLSLFVGVVWILKMIRG